MTRQLAVAADLRKDAFDWAAILKQPHGIRALTVRQPWAWAILHGKPIENRRTLILPEGRVLWLHAGSWARWDPDGQDSPLVQAAWRRAGGGQPLTRDPAVMPFGAIVALMESGGCHHAADCTGTDAAGGRRITRMCTPWAASGQFHIGLARVAPLPEPVPCRGMPGLWPPQEDALAALLAQVAAFADAQRPSRAQAG